MLDDEPQERSTAFVGVGGPKASAVLPGPRSPGRMLPPSGTCLGSTRLLNLV